MFTYWTPWSIYKIHGDKTAFIRQSNNKVNWLSLLLQIFFKTYKQEGYI